MHSKQDLTKLTTRNDLAPQVMRAFWESDSASVSDGAIPDKYKDLIAVAVALATRCPHCIEIHRANARRAGATEVEMAEAAMIVAALRAGTGGTRAAHTL